MEAECGNQVIKNQSGEGQMVDKKTGTSDNRIQLEISFSTSLCQKKNKKKVFVS